MIGAVARLEWAEVRRSRWLAGSVLLALGTVGFFVVVASRESAIVGFTGYGRVLAGVVQVSLLLVPLLALFSTLPAVAGARQSGQLEFIFAAPIERREVWAGLFWTRMGAVAAPILGTALALAVAASAGGTPLAPSLLATFGGALVGQTACFAALGMLLSTVSRTPEQALVRGLMAWLTAAVLVDFVLLGALLRWSLPPQVVFALATLNPVQAGRVAVLAQVEPDLAVLGPVGTWAASNLGVGATVAWGVGWPLVLAGGLAWAGRRAFERG
jgi:ABC-type transport system involved in multi-copper enzyme maturation permease subunit